jgi:CIC family chloride channel protein
LGALLSRFDAETFEQCADPALDVVAHAADLIELCADGTADSPVFVAHAVGDVEYTDAVPHRHDHVGRLQNLGRSGAGDPRWVQPALLGVSSSRSARPPVLPVRRSSRCSIWSSGLPGGARRASSLPRLRGSGGGEISEALWLRGGQLELLPSLVRGTLSIITVGMGASLGREGAPQLAGAAFASELCERSKTISHSQRRLLVAAAAGAGMAAVYNVPLGGALFALEVLLGSLALPLVLPALLTSLIATAVAWIVIPTRATYLIPSYSVAGREIVWAALIGPLAGLTAVLWVRLVARANRSRPARQTARVLAPIVIFTALGALAIQYPQLLGNGKELAQLAFVGKLSVGLLAVLFILKPLVTAACLGSGAPGGLFTPTLVLGVLFGALLGHAWSDIWPGSPIGSYALIGAGGVLAAAMQGPLAATVLMLELTHGDGSLTVPLLLAAAEATVVARLLGAPSIYSARLAESDETAPGR